MPVSISPSPDPSRSRESEIFVSFVLRSISDFLIAPPPSVDVYVRLGLETLYPGLVEALRFRGLDLRLDV